MSRTTWTNLLLIPLSVVAFMFGWRMLEESPGSASVAPPRLERAKARAESGSPFPASRPAPTVITPLKHGPGDGLAGKEASRADKTGAMPGETRMLLDAIRQVESGGIDRSIGDGGRSKGPYMCGRAAWSDGGGNLADYDRLVWDRTETEKIMLAYWAKYGAKTDEQRARAWNGGPNGMHKTATLAYWRKVQEAMK
jgi:hypothetical protein